MRGCMLETLVAFYSDRSDDQALSSQGYHALLTGSVRR